MGQLTPGQFLFLLVIVASFGLFTSLALAKWQHEKREKERRLQAAQAKPQSRSQLPPSQSLSASPRLPPDDRR
jgi:cytochrome oxidase assembly protein ShyY1